MFLVDWKIKLNLVLNAVKSYDIPECSDGVSSIAANNQGDVYTASPGDSILNKISPNGTVSQIQLADGYNLANFTINADDQIIINFIDDGELYLGVAELLSNGSLDILYQQQIDEQDPASLLYSYETAVTPSGDIWIGTYPAFDQASLYPLLPRFLQAVKNPIVNTSGSTANKLLPGADNCLWFVQGNGLIGRVDSGSADAVLYGGLITPFPDGFFGSAEDTALYNEYYLGLYSGSNAVDSQGNLWVSDGLVSRILKITALSTNPEQTDSDADSIPDATENAAPNSGDGNGDGTPDREQANVTSLPNADGVYVTLVVSEGTTIDSTSIEQVSQLATQDSGKDYPLGLVSFTATTTTGATIPVELYFATPTKANAFTARKYNTANQTYGDIPGATLTDVTIGGQHSVKLTYNITDGGILDQDGVANGTILDPVGLATTSLADTGENTWAYVLGVMTLLGAGVLLHTTIQRRRI
jgi:hypothetical protein